MALFCQFVFLRVCTDIPVMSIAHGTQENRHDTVLHNFQLYIQFQHSTGAQD